MFWPKVPAFFVLAMPAMLDAQSLPIESLGRALARSSDGFTEIGGLRELPDGRVLVVDYRENRSVLVDFRAGSTRDLTRPGAGPLELPLVLSVVPWKDGGVLIGGHRDALVVTAAGELAGRLPSPFTGLRSWSAPRFTDDAGRWYGVSVDAITRGADGSFIPSLGETVVRWDTATGRIDSLVRLATRDPEQPLGRPWRPYPMHDVFAVRPNGDVLVVRAKGYVVEVWRDGQRVAAKPVPGYAPIPIGPRERDAYRDAKAREPAGGGGSTSPGAAERESDRAARRRALNIDDAIFPPFLPPTLEVNATFVDGDGITWVARSHAAGDTNRLYDLFDGTGTLVRRVRIANRGRVVGFGRGVVYLATPDADDVLWLERVALR